MIVFRYLIGEVFKSQLAVFLILITIIMSQRFVRILADASEGELPGQLVLTILSLKLPQLAVLILPLAAFLGVLIAYGRIYADSEMTVLHATGVSEWYVTRLTLVLSVVMALASGFLTLYFSPWAMEKEYQIIEKAEADAGLSSLIPGRFQQTSNGKAVVFVQSIGREGGELQHVFLAQNGANLEEGTRIIYAQAGQVKEDAQGAQQLILDSGRRYVGTAFSPAYEVLEFDSYQVQIREQEVEQKRRKISSLTTMELFNTGGPEATAELHWRLAIPLSIPILMLIAVPLAKVNPRQGKFGRLLPALALYLLYYILLIASRSAIEDGKLPEWLGMWWIHGLGLAFGASLLVKHRTAGQKLKALITRRGAHV